jgi:hypothetical protein
MSNVIDIRGLFEPEVDYINCTKEQYDLASQHLEALFHDCEHDFRELIEDFNDTLADYEYRIELLARKMMHIQSLV